MTDIVSRGLRPTASAPAARPELPQTGSIVLGLLLALTSFGTLFIHLKLPQNLAPVDLAIVIVNLVGLAILVRRPSFVSALFKREFVWLWLLAIGEFIGLFGVGIQGWALSAAFRDLAPLFFLFSFAALAHWHRKGVRWALGGYVAGMVLTSVLVLVDGRSRPAATFGNPSYAGHYLALGILLVLFSDMKRWIRVAVVILAVAAIYRTQSFGSESALAVALIYFAWCRLDRFGRSLSIAARVLLVAVFLALLFSGLQVPSDDSPPPRPGSETATQRFDRSSATRYELWSQGLALIPSHPLGLGPGGVKNLGLAGEGAELHNDYLAYLVERSVIGLVGLLGFGLVLWRWAPRYGVARLVILTSAVGSITRETLNFRHLWVALAIALVIDHARRRPQPVPEGPDQATPSADAPPEPARAASEPAGAESEGSASPPPRKARLRAQSARVASSVRAARC